MKIRTGSTVVMGLLLFGASSSMLHAGMLESLSVSQLDIDRVLGPESLRSLFSQQEFKEQYGGGGFGGAGAPGLTNQVVRGTRVIPALTISERYDTNVINAPKTQGFKADDFVTSVRPQLSIHHGSELVTASVSGGATGEYYAQHPLLGYLGYNAGASLGLTPLVRRYLPDSSLSISYGFFYTPTPPSWLQGGASSFHTPQDQTSPDVFLADTYLRGIQSTRVNTTSHSASVAGAIPLSANLRIQAAYNYSKMSFGGVPTGVSSTSPFLPTTRSTNTHMVSLGPSYKISPIDAVFLQYMYTKSEYGGGSPGGAGMGSQATGFTAHGMSVGWLRTLGPTFSARAFGGVSLVENDQTNLRGNQAGTASGLTYNGGASLSWLQGFTAWTANYSVGVYPSVFGAPVPVISHFVSLTGARRLGIDWFLAGQLAVSDQAAISSVSGANGGLAYRSYSGGLSLSYQLAPSATASLAYTYLLNEGSSGAGDAVSYTRQIVSLSIAKAFN